jgi:hypothetical protein
MSAAELSGAASKTTKTTRRVLIPHRIIGLPCIAEFPDRLRAIRLFIAPFRPVGEHKDELTGFAPVPEARWSALGRMRKTQEGEIISS